MRDAGCLMNKSRLFSIVTASYPQPGRHAWEGPALWLDTSPTPCSAQQQQQEKVDLRTEYPYQAQHDNGRHCEGATVLSAYSPQDAAEK
jgi:hypothetical protein